MVMNLSINLKAENLLTLTSRWLLRKYGIEIFFLLYEITQRDAMKVIKTNEVVSKLKEMQIAYLDEQKTLVYRNVVEEMALKDKISEEEFMKIEKNRIYMPVAYRLREGHTTGIYEIGQLRNKKGYRMTSFGLKVGEAINNSFITGRPEIQYYYHFCREKLKEFRYL